MFGRRRHRTLPKGAKRLAGGLMVLIGLLAIGTQVMLSQGLSLRMAGTAFILAVGLWLLVTGGEPAHRERETA